MKLIAAPKIKGLIEAPKSMYIAGVDPISKRSHFAVMVVEDNRLVKYESQSSLKYPDIYEQMLKMHEKLSQ